MAGEVVGWLHVLTADEDKDDDNCGSQRGAIEICGNEQFYLGRDMELCRYTWCDDLTISRLHLRIHCILYEQDPVSHIAPFVYATDLSANGTYLKKRGSNDAASQDEGVLMGRKTAFLLDHGDELHISDTITLIYLSRCPMQRVQLTPSQQVETQRFRSRYLVTARMLGEGGFGKVLVGVDQKTRRQLACKVVRLDTLTAKQLRSPTAIREQCAIQARERCYREFNILKDLCHPNIIALEKVFCGYDNIYIFQELMTGGDLFSFLEFKGGRLDGVQAAAIVLQILKGIAYLHGLDIVHRDLKPDNILVSSLQDNARVVITDFGNARFVPKSSQSAKNRRMFSHVGTLEYAAPEIYRANPAIPVELGYSKSIDMWSIGSLTATVLSGDHLFTDRDHPDYHRNPQGVIVGLAAICDLNVLDDHHHPSWKSIQRQPKDFIKRLLVLREEDRMTALEALAHPWFTCYESDSEELYACSIVDWEPRDTNVQLVEDLSKLLQDRVIADTPGSNSHPQTNPQNFAPTRSDTTAPASSEDSSVQHLYTRALQKSPALQSKERSYAGQAQPLCSCRCHSKNQHSNAPRQHEQSNQKPHVSTAQVTEAFHRYEVCTSNGDNSSEIRVKHVGRPPNQSLCRKSVNDVHADSRYESEEMALKESSEAFRGNCSQPGCSRHPLSSPDVFLEQDSVLVRATPIEEQQRIAQPTQASILVSETPPDL